MAHELHWTHDLRQAGYSYDEIRRLLLDGAIERVRRGVYVAGAKPDDRGARHRLEVLAAARVLSGAAVISHASAAVLYGLPVWGAPLDRVHVTRHRTGGGRRSVRAHVHPASLRPDDITIVDGMALTSVARTVVDVARTHGFEPGVVVADAALAEGLTDEGSLLQALAHVFGRRGVPTARRVVEFADGRSESVGESRSRVAIAAAGLPRPVPQWTVCDEDGWELGRTDFGWPEHNVAGEFDGRIKYGRLLRDGESAGDAVYREKLREDALRQHVRTVIRWRWDDLRDFGRVAGRIRRALTEPDT